MTASTTVEWQVANQRYLVAAMELLRAILRRHAARGGENGEDATELHAANASLTAARRVMSTPPALELIGAAFGLSNFEQMLLLLCAAMELDATFAPLCASAQGDPQLSFPTFGLALAALDHPHWSAVTPDGPLRRWHLVEVGSGATLTSSSLRADERIVHCLAGVASQEERLVPLLGQVVEPSSLAPSHQQLASRLVATWSQPDLGHDLPVAQLIGGDLESKRH